MLVSVASGKGGTGKTTVATNLAVMLAENGRKVQLLDCDVEAPNAHLFLHPAVRETLPVTVPIPRVDEARCTGCGACADLCQYGAIVMVKDRVLTFPELCHSCGGCALVCPEGAIQEEPWPVGVVERGEADEVPFAQGRLEIGEPRAAPLIKALKKSREPGALTIIDAPSGTSCPAIEAVRGSDFVILVAEPTPFGLHDLLMAVDMCRALELSFGVVVNRAGLGDERVEVLCERDHIPLLAKLPDDRRVAEAYSRGELVIDALPQYRKAFQTLFGRVLRAMSGKVRVKVN